MVFYPNATILRAEQRKGGVQYKLYREDHTRTLLNFIISDKGEQYDFTRSRSTGRDGSGAVK